MILGAFYDDVLRELIVAVGAALFVANVYALIRRKADADRVSANTVSRARPGSPVRSQANPAEKRELAQVPIVRTVLYASIGFVVMVAGIASLTT
ncbi:MAG TPA: hypothetical protein VFZ17_10315 [Acidimicrobiia bacterium]|nr:hypothetical protein [Acidimicrobiia bacterium]